MAGKESGMGVMKRHADIIIIIIIICRFFSLLLLNMYTFKEHNVTRKNNNLKILSFSFISII